MTSVVLQPAGSAASLKHYVDTIENPVPLSDMEPYLADRDRAILESIYQSESIPTWGVTPGEKRQNETKWNRLEVGDVTLFARSGRIVSSGVLTHKLHSAALAEHLWHRDKKGATWEFIYFLDEINSHDIPVERLNHVVGYKPNNVIQGFSVLDEEKSIAILEHFDLASFVYFPPVTEREFYSILENEDSLDELSTTSRRKEQGFLRKSLFGDSQTGRCCMCGKSYPVAFLVTAHIKKRSACTLEERKDYKNIVASMCAFGCDDLYEKHYLYVEDGIIKLNLGKESTFDLKKRTVSLENARCSAWRDGNRQYFEWHRRKAKSYG